MRTLSLETTKLLDKLYNLRGKDSVILVEMDKQKEKSESTLEKTTKQKSELQEKISRLEKQHDELQAQGEDFVNVLSGIDRNDFSTVLDSLNIDFNPEAIIEKVNSNLPKTIEKVTTEQKKSEEELVEVEEEMNNAITTIEELGLRRDTALSNQSKLNEYFELALNGKINITRDSITSLLEQFDFSEEEQREAAKILMFPEDALFSYNEKVMNSDVAGKTISDVMNEAKDAFVDEGSHEDLTISVDDKKEPEVEDYDIKIDNIISNDSFEIPENEDDKILVDDVKEIEEEPVFNPFVIDDSVSNNDTNNDTNNESTNVFDSSFNIDDFSIVDNDDVVVDEDVNIEDSLNSLGFDYLDFRSEDLDDLKNNFDKDTITKNVELAKNNNIDLDLFIEHSTLLYDKELKEKVETLLNIGKEPIDIYLNPGILVKYTAEKLNNAIELLKNNGMDPKNVPLMAY